MTGKVIDSGANSVLLVLLPLALITILVFVFWPLIIGVFVITLVWKLWQTYQWQKLSGEIDPLFNQLIQAHQGCLTVLDLSMKTSLNSSTAKWYLDRKAAQYGAVKRLYEDKGIVYYFLTASALGSIFDDSEPEEYTDVEIAPEENVNSSYSDTTKVKSQHQPEIKATVSTDSKVSSTQENITNQTETAKTPEVASNYKNTENKSVNLSLNQGELAKRLKVHSSTVGKKRKSDDDFSLWSQTKDPDGIPWCYKEDEKIFVPLE